MADSSIEKGRMMVSHEASMRTIREKSRSAHRGGLLTRNWAILVPVRR